MLHRKTIKALFLITFIFFSLTTTAKNYYLSSSSGNDSNSGTSESSAWRSLSKISALRLFPGDQVLFKRGDKFYGNFSISYSGSSSNPIVFSAYGSGAKPVISGFKSVNSWSNKGGNIWESSDVISNLQGTNMVVVNGINTEMGRYPNSGYFTYKSHVNKVSITDNEGLSGSPNWTGAELVLFATTYVIERNPIISQSGGTLTYVSTSPNKIQRDGLKYFIQNDARTLDTQNEWYYSPVTKKLKIYSTTTPSTVKVAAIDKLIEMGGLSGEGTKYITLDNISFEGSNKVSVEVDNSKYITIQNCDFNFSGGDAIYGPYHLNSTSLKIENCTFSNTNNNAIDLTADFDNAQIRNNSIKNTGLLPGMGQSGDANSIAIHARGESSVIEYNNIENTGYIGIHFDNNYSRVNNNFVNHSLLVKVDGGGIYTWNGKGPDRPIYKGRKVLNNIVLNTPTGSGIYMDDGTQGVEVAGNTVAFCAYGIYLHGNQNMNVHDNTVYDNEFIQLLLRSEIYEEIRNVNLNNNVFVSKDASQLNVLYRSKFDDIPLFGTADNNYYARPIDDNLVFQTQTNGLYNPVKRDLASWQQYSKQDLNSKKSPKVISTQKDLRFEYNNSKNSKTISLDANYIDVRGKSYDGAITLAPYSSAVLIKNGAATKNESPKANAGSNQTITLPSNTVTLSGTGTDSDGSIISYYWSKVDGPLSESLTSPSSSKTTLSELEQGIYKYELKVTDNNGSIGRDTVTITVQPAVASNVETSNTSVAPFSANAGPDQTISIPTNSVNLSASATGSVTAYQWRQLGGPSKVMSSVDNSTAEVTNLIEGIYEFEIKVTNSANNIDRDTMRVIVANNEHLTSNAGPDQFIVLPENGVRLSGNGTGSITAYQWRQLSGPIKVTSSVDFAETYITGLVEGVFQFELKVLDNKNGCERDTMQVTVSSPALGVNAGADQTITLPTNTVTLSGSGQGLNISYQWRQLSGPSIVMSSVDYASTPVNGLIQGKYEFELKVLDTVKNISVRDTMQVAVNVSNTTYASKTMTTTTTSTSGATLGDKEAFASVTAPSQQKTVAPASTDLKIYPNPVEDITTLEINIAEPNSNVVIQISDMKGTLVYKKQLTAGVGLLTEKINMSNYTSGTYIITVIINSVERQTIQALKL